MNLRGKFIVLDGPEGVGKSTQIALLAERLEQEGADVVKARDPGSTRLGERIREVLLNPDHAEMSMRCEMLLYMAARAQMMAELVLPALERGNTVVCDRFVSSTLAYQLGGDGLTAAEIRGSAEAAIRGRWPDLTLILDMPVSASMGRLARDKDRIERRPAEYHERVRRNFLHQAAENPRAYRVIDAAAGREAVAAAVWRMVTEAAALC